MINVCLVGCGYIAKQHLAALLGNDSIEVVGLVDPNQEAAVTLSKQLPHPEQCQVVVISFTSFSCSLQYCDVFLVLYRYSVVSMPSTSPSYPMMQLS